MFFPEQTFDGRHAGWHALVEAGFGASRIDAALTFYDEPHRVYHDRRHVQEMVAVAGQLGLVLSATQALALLFHDAIYVPGAGRGANEALSAQLLRVFAGGIDEQIVCEACSIVLDSVEHVPSSAPAALVLDLDLLRLAAAAEDFELHSRSIFAEQRPLIAIADDEAAWRFFAARRVPFLERLLAHESVFHSPFFIERFEAAARRNLAEAIRRVRLSDSHETA